MTVNQRILLHLFLLLIPHTLQSKQVLKKEADDLYRLLSQSKPDSGRAILYLQLGNYYLEKPGSFQADMDSAFAYGYKAQDLSLSLDFPKGVVGSQKVFAHVFLGSKKI